MANPIKGCSVYVLIKAWDCDIAECLGIYSNEKDAIAQARAIELYGDDMGHKVEKVIIEKHYIE